MTEIQFRRGTAAQWVAANTVLGIGEPGFETDTNKEKRGNGVTAWNSLGYYGAQVSALTHTVNDTNYTILASDQLVAISALTATRILTLPTSALTAGQQVTIVDDTGLAHWYPIIIAGTVNGGPAAVLKDEWGTITLTWTGTQWSTAGWAATAIPATITGTTYYVSAAGSNSNNGTSPSTPWLTVGKANAAALNPGDGILFHGGDTFSDAFLTLPSVGTVTAPVVYGSYGTGQAILTKGFFMIGTSGSSATAHLVIDNLNFASVTATNLAVQVGNTAHPSNNVTIQRCTISDLGDTTTSTDGISLTGTNFIVVGNYIHDIPNNGMRIGVAGESDGCTIANNLVYNCGLNTGIGASSHGIYGDISNATCANNVFVKASTGSSAISMRYRNWTTRRNHIAACAGGIDYFETDTTQGKIRVRNNRIAGATSYGIYVPSIESSNPQAIQSFVIEDNDIQTTAAARGTELSLQSTLGGYEVDGNTGVHGAQVEFDEKRTALTLLVDPSTGDLYAA